MNNLENKYLYEGFPNEAYRKHKVKIEKQIEAINREKANLGITISNLNKKIDRCFEVTQNIGKY